FTFLLKTLPTPAIYTLSLHDALPISDGQGIPDSGDRRKRSAHRRCSLVADQRLPRFSDLPAGRERSLEVGEHGWQRTGENEVSGDRKSTRLNSSHVSISYAVFCLKKK